jgi:hypothetical protein
MLNDSVMAEAAFPSAPGNSRVTVSMMIAAPSSAAAEHEVPNRNFAVGEMLAYPLIHSLVTPA